MKTIRLTTFFAISLLFGLMACSSEPQSTEIKKKEIKMGGEEKAAPKANPNGVGPIKDLTLGEYDAKLAEEGAVLFESLCTACHKLDKRHVGPALAGVLDRRTPAWVMNMILVPEKMVAEDEVAKALLAEYLAPMANQNLTEPQARAILEFLRQ